MSSAQYFAVNPTQIAPMAKDIKEIDFVSEGWKWSVWSEERYGYLKDFVKSLQLGGDDWIVAVGKRDTVTSVRPEVNALLEIKSKTAQATMRVKFAGHAGFPYPRARTTALIVLEPLLLLKKQAEEGVRSSPVTKEQTPASSPPPAAGQ